MGLYYRAGGGTLAGYGQHSNFQTQDSKCHEAETMNLDLTVLDTESGAWWIERMSEGMQGCLARGTEAGKMKVGVRGRVNNFGVGTEESEGPGAP